MSEMSDRQLTEKAGWWVDLSSSLEEARTNVITDTTYYNKCLSKFEDDPSNANQDAVVAAKNRFDESKSRFDSINQECFKFRRKNAGEMGAIEQRAVEIKKSAAAEPKKGKVF